jgi:hypothetical protein
MRHLRDPVPSVRERRRDVPDRVDKIVARAMAKRPADRFPSTEAMMGAIEGALADTGEGAGRNEATGVHSRVERPSPSRSAARPGPRRRQRRRRFAPLLLALLVVGAGAIALGLILAGRDGGGSGAAGSIGGVKLTAFEDYDPQGDQSEHPESVANATDGDVSTFWTTETYRTFSKPGVGLILDAGKAVSIEHLQIVSDEPGFTAEILAGDNPTGGFVPFSEEQEIGRRTTLELAGGKSYRYYVVWITDPNRRAHVNEVRAD